VAPSARVAAHVHHFWSIRWDLNSPFTAEVLPHPSAQILHIEAESQRHGEILGVRTGRLTRCLAGSGQTFGVTFRPAMLQPLVRAGMTSLTDRTIPLARALGPRASAWTAEILDAPDVDARVAIAEAFLEQVLPPVSPRLARVRDLVETMAADRTILRVEDASEAAGLDVRALQREFRIHVGLSPKRVIQRYRLQEAAAQLTGPRPPPLAALAASLGYADQAHFGRDFKRAVGQPPRAFAR
jgi:AraC-like DNA-binding protein